MGPGVGFENITVLPTKTGTANAGGHGIVYDAPSSNTEGKIANVTIAGALADATAAGMGTGIYFAGGSASPRIGDGVTIAGGAHGIFVDSTSFPTITGSAGAPTAIRGAGRSCIRVSSISTTTAPAIRINSGASTSNYVTVSDCGGPGAILIDTAFGGVTSIIDRATISRGGPNRVFPGIHLLNSGNARVTNATIDGLGADAILAEGSAKLSVKDTSASNTTATGPYQPAGLLVTGAANATVVGLTANGNAGDGIKCELNGSISARGSTTLKNGLNGMWITGNCLADLGSTTDGGKNVFNKTSMKNAFSGLCFDSSVALVTASSSTWSCNAIGPGCSSTGAPTRDNGSSGDPFSCGHVPLTDITAAGGTAVSAIFPTCCP
jgi:hypothetical protein